MLCRSCGTEIAAKALICFRCGAATTEPTFKPAAPRRRPSALSLLTSILALILLVVLALYMGRAPYGGTPRLVSWAAVAIAVVVVALRAYVRRR